MNLKRIPSYTKELLCWAFVHYVGLFLAVVIVAATPACVRGTELSVQAPGYILQLLGMILAIRGLWAVRRYFEHPTVKQTLIEWYKRRPKFKRDSTLKVGGGVYALNANVAGEVSMFTWTPDNPDKPTEERLEAVIKNVETLKEKERENRQSLNSLRSALRDHKETTSTAHESLQEQFDRKLETLHTKDLRLSLLGLLWITVGFSMTTFSSQLASLLAQ